MIFTYLIKPENMKLGILCGLFGSLAARNIANIFTGTIEDFLTYNGTKAVTVSGRTCQKWKSSYPHPHGWNNDPEDATMENNHNYCR